MAAMHEEEPLELKECANCGSTEGLGRCSRCHRAWFCSKKCQKSYWPFHVEVCKRNEFADAVEAREPKFAHWMRKHGKLAVLKDDEVDRIERASHATSGASRADVVESMYGRLNPKPLPPSYTAEEKRSVREREEHEALEARQRTSRDHVWQAIEIPKDMGLSCARYKWKQDQSYVEVYHHLPEGVPASQVQVEIAPQINTFLCSWMQAPADPLTSPPALPNQRAPRPAPPDPIGRCRHPAQHLVVTVAGLDTAKGQLYAHVQAEMSTWVIQEGVLEITLLKRNRRGHYDDRKSNADTFWFSLFHQVPETDRLPLPRPPLAYYDVRPSRTPCCGPWRTGQRPGACEAGVV